MDDWIHPRVSAFLLDSFEGVMDIAKRHGLPTNFQAGERPRHFAGALDRPDKVRLLLLLAEPGSYPYDWEKGRSKETWLADVCSDGLGQRGNHRFIYDPAHTVDEHYKIQHAMWPARFIAEIWPELSVSKRMGRVVVANSFWMQSKSTGGAVPSSAIHEFLPVLRQFIDLFPNAITIAAGSKSVNRVEKAGRACIAMRALTLPEYNKPAARKSHTEAAEKARALIGT